ncbi:MAG: M48 family metalloprotease [Planctomycetes bacterium]|nr:M48 family metalloprotease [Planctomycetota bacterium]MCB9934304.1 M48 family metalloprotease [Planctomycetota bacterium]
MFNIVGILVALMLAQMGRGQGVIVGWESVAAAAGAMLGVLAFHYSVASHLIERFQLIKLRLAATPPDAPPELRPQLYRERELLLRRVPLFRLGVDALILALFAMDVFVFGWTDFVAKVWRVPMHLDLLPQLLPYFAMLAASWVGQYRIERRVRGSDWRPWRFAAFQARANLLTVMPIAVIYAAWWALLTFVPVIEDLRSSFAFLEIAMQMALVVVLSFFVPLVVRLILPGGPLPDGRLRRRLETYARDHKLRVSQILVWRTGSRMFATAFVIGLLAPFRYVFITDALLKRLNEDELVAVFAHEMGHVKHRHLWWLLAFIISFTVVLLGLMHGLHMLLPGPNYEYLGMAVLVLYAYWVFGYVSRRFERQADDYAAQTTSPELISQVFLKLGMDNPVAMKKSGWRHFSLEQRVREIILAKAHPEVKRIFRAELWRGLAAGIGVTLLAALLLIQPVREDVVSGLATYELNQFDRARVEDAGPARLQELRERTLARTRAMGRLDEDYLAVSLWYAGVVEGLSGQDTDSLDQLAATLNTRRQEADTQEEREDWLRQLRELEATRVAISRAREKGTSFFEEYEAERIHRGLRSAD